ncbi:DsbA family protein [Frigidibacter sp. RF13]|uniref:DsbA family protein n=1 Tax=Frigidibacter sp. RF13 TaxID=2997340 RepID=UPI00226F462F|nr:DsbA family protein [Frigidibacter sp. RF13]
MKKLLVPAVTALAAVGGAWWYAGSTTAELTTLIPPASAQESATTSSAVSLVPDMILGDQNAPVTVVEYASFTCPHCANFHDTVYDEFKKNYIDTGKVKFVYREVYFDKYGLWAAMVARCGGPEKYFGISDMLYDGQRDWLASGADQGIADELRKIGLKAGMTADQVNACLNDNEQAKAMVTAYQTNATNDNVKGTPTFLINGELHSGEMSYADFAALLDAALAK